MLKSNVDGNIIIFMGNKNIHWISEDCGETLRIIVSKIAFI